MVFGKNEATWAGVGGLVGALIGGSIVYFCITKRKIDALKEREKVLNKEIDNLISKKKSETNTINVTGTGSSLSGTVEDYIRMYNKTLDDPGQVGEIVHIQKEGIKTSDVETARFFADPAELEHPSDDESEDDILDKKEELERRRREWMPEEEIKREEDPNYRAAAEAYEQEERNKKRRPKLITADSYSEDYLNFGKIHLYYYIIDDVLATEQEEMIEDVFETVGNCLDKYGFRYNDEAVIYVRNMNVGEDYEIVKVFSAFDDVRSW